MDSRSIKHLDHHKSKNGGRDFNFLPIGFEPSINHVIIGRGKRCYNHEGNKKLRRTVIERLEEYSCAPSKSDKSHILYSIISQFRKGCPAGGFVKQDLIQNRWFDVGDFLAKEKISQTFRDTLKEICKTSSGRKKQSKEHFTEVNELRHKPSRSFTALSDAHYNVDSSTSSRLEPRSITCYSGLVASLTSDNPFEPTPIQEHGKKKRKNLGGGKKSSSKFEDGFDSRNEHCGDIDILYELEEIDVTGLAETVVDCKDLTKSSTVADYCISSTGSFDCQSDFASV